MTRTRTLGPPRPDTAVLHFQTRGLEDIVAVIRAYPPGTVDCPLHEGCKLFDNPDYPWPEGVGPARICHVNVAPELLYNELFG